ncbi:MAG: hypothetical protein WCC12_22955, partial [Anaerolineales bacterium]
KRRNRHGEWIERKTRTGVYYCPQVHPEHVSSDCPRTIGSKKADDDVWEKVCRAINQPEILLAQACNVIEELRANAASLGKEQENIQKELDAIILERQWVITQARKGGISEEDMNYQLGALSLQELSLKRDLASVSQAVDIESLGDWETAVIEYLEDLRTGIESLNTAPQNAEERCEIFELKKQAVSTLVRRVTIDRNRELHVEISLNLLALLENGSNSQSGGGLPTRGQIQRGGTYTRRQSTHAHRRHCASCG